MIQPARPPLPQPDADPARRKAVQDAARAFESVFLTQAVDEMLKTAEIGRFGGGQAEEMWRSFLARAMADKIAEGGTTGIARSIETLLTAYKP